MDKMNNPRGLIRYTTENALEGKPWHLLRPRVLIYSGLLAAIAEWRSWSLLLRMPLQVDVLRDRNPCTATRPRGWWRTCIRSGS